MMFMFFIFCSLFLMYKTKNPLFICLMLVSLAVEIGFLLNKILSKWFIYLIILLFLGGMMILFIYMASLSSNSKSSISPTMLKFLVVFFMLSSLNWFFNRMSFNSLESIQLSELYNFNESLVMMMYALYLLLLLIVSLQLINIYASSLKNYF